MKIYCRNPFDKSVRGVRVTNPCKPGHEGAKDLNFPGMPYGTPVFAMESGSVAEIRRGRPHCPTSDCPGFANNVVVKGSDGFFTEYAHITPVTKAPNHAPPGSTLYWMWYNRPLRIGSSIREGDLLGWVDNSGYTIGDPSIHIGRYTPGDPATLHSRPSLCDWYIQGVDSPLMIPPATCFPGGVYPHHYLNR